MPNCATQSSIRIVEGFMKRSPNIRMLPDIGGAYLSKALNHGIRNARYELIARFDSDDVCMPFRMIKQFIFLQENPNIVVLGGNTVLIGEEGEYLGLRKVSIGISNIKKSLKHFDVISHPTVMMRRREILSLGGYNESFPNSEDYELWLRVSNKYDIDNLEFPLIQYRVHGENVSLMRQAEQNFFSIKAKLMHSTIYSIAMKFQVPFNFLENIASLIDPKYGIILPNFIKVLKQFVKAIFGFVIPRF